MHKLSNKQHLFVAEYLIDLNATQAYIRAGYKVKSTNVAAVNAQKMLRNAKVQAAIEAAMRERENRTGITQDRVLRELEKIAFSNATDFTKVVTKTIKQDAYSAEKGEWEKKEVEHQCVEITDTDKLSPDKKAAVAEISEGKYGITIKTYDKIKALELIGRHLGMFKDKVELSGQVNNPYEGLTIEQLLKLVGDEDDS